MSERPSSLTVEAAIHDSHRVEAWMDPGLRRDDVKKDRTALRPIFSFMARP
jgi:hypothetical protein